MEWALISAYCGPIFSLAYGAHVMRPAGVTAIGLRGPIIFHGLRRAGYETYWRSLLMHPVLPCACTPVASVLVGLLLCVLKRMLLRLLPRLFARL